MVPKSPLELLLEHRAKTRPDFPGLHAARSVLIIRPEGLSDPSVDFGLCETALKLHLFWHRQFDLLQKGKGFL